MSSTMNESCTGQSTDDIKDGLIVRAAIGGISFIASVIAISIILLFRRCRPQFLREISTTEQLIILTAGLAIFRACSEMFQLSNLYFWSDVADKNSSAVHLTSSVNSTARDLCWATGFFSHWSFGSMLLGIQILLLHLVLQLTVSVEFTKRRLTQMVYILSPILLPLVLSSWVPFIPFHKNITYFGLGEGGWCWISEYQVSDCIEGKDFNETLTKAVKIVRSVLWIGPFIFFLVMDLLIIVIAYPLLLCRKEGITVEDKKSLAKQHGPILCIVSVSMICYVFAVSHDILSTWNLGGKKETKKCLLYAHAVASSIWGIVIAFCVIFYILALRYTQQPHEEYEDIDRNDPKFTQSEYVVGSDGTVSHASGILSDREEMFDSYQYNNN